MCTNVNRFFVHAPIGTNKIKLDRLLLVSDFPFLLGYQNIVKIMRHKDLSLHMQLRLRQLFSNTNVSIISVYRRNFLPSFRLVQADRCGSLVCLKEQNGGIIFLTRVDLCSSIRILSSLKHETSLPCQRISAQRSIIAFRAWPPRWTRGAICTTWTLHPRFACIPNCSWRAGSTGSPRHTSHTSGTLWP